MVGTAVLALHPLDIALTLRTMDTTTVALFLVSIRHVPVTNIDDVAHHPVTTMNMAVMNVATDPHHQRALAAVHPSTIRTHLLVEATSVTRMPLHRLVVPMTTLTLPMDMGDRGSEARLREHMVDTMSGHVTGDCSSLPLFYSFRSLLRGGASANWVFLRARTGLIISEHPMSACSNHPTVFTMPTRAQRRQIGHVIGQGFDNNENGVADTYRMRKNFLLEEVTMNLAITEIDLCEIFIMDAIV